MLEDSFLVEENEYSGYVFLGLGIDFLVICCYDKY